MLIFVNNGDIRENFRVGGDVKDDRVGVGNFRVGFSDDFVIDRDEAALNETLQAGAIIFRMLLYEYHVEAFAGIFGGGVWEDGVAVDDAGKFGFAEFFTGDNHISPQAKSFLSGVELRVGDLVGVCFASLE